MALLRYHKGAGGDAHVDVVLGGQLWYTQDSLGQVPLFVLSCTRTQKERGNLKHAQASTRSPDVRYNPPPMYNPVHAQLKRAICQLFCFFFFFASLPARPPSWRRHVT